MDAASLIACLVNLENAAAKSGDFTTRAFVVEAQDWILRAQRENLELRRENHVLRLRQSAPYAHRRGDRAAKEMANGQRGVAFARAV